MNKFRALLFTTLALSTSIAVVSCGPSDNPPAPKEFSFYTSFVSGKSTNLYLNETERLVVNEVNPNSTVREYTCVVTEADKEYITVTKGVDEEGKTYFTVEPIKVTGADKTVQIKIRESNSMLQNTRRFSITEKVDPQNAGKNYSSDGVARTEILGKLEEYAMENMLSGITLFQQGGYIRKSNRLKLATNNNEYIPGYGLGILTEGWLEGTQGQEYPDYLHTASSSDPGNINAWDAAGSQVADLNSYISASYWSTKMAAGGTDYEWYPVLAADEVGPEGSKVANTRPIPLQYDAGEQQWVEVDDFEPTDMYKRWRIYVKTSDISDPEGVQYRMSSKANAALKEKFDGRGITIEDYEFTYQLLLSQEAKLSRGTEMAYDTSYGIKGATKFYNKTKGKTSGAACDAIWETMKATGELGIVTGRNNDCDYIDIELINQVNPFYAMYYLSSNLYTPIPKSFIQSLDTNPKTEDDPDGNYINGAANFGRFSGKGIYNNIISTGPFYFEEWNRDQAQIFIRNNDWYEVEEGIRYKIPGVVIRIHDTSSNPDAIYNHFANGELDYCTLPKSQAEHPLVTDIVAIGDSTFKLNVNACDQDRWNDLFGRNGSISVGPDNAYKTKPWMSNINFLKGLFWSIDRQSFATARGATPSINYFADAYMSNGEARESYNTTEAHKNAIAKFHDVDPQTGIDNYGYSPAKAKQYFAAAIQELVEQGKLTYGKSASQPTIIRMNIWWMYQSDINDYGDEIVNYFISTFNDPDVCGGLVKLEIPKDMKDENYGQWAVTDWEAVYNDHLMVGKYDLGFGAISGDTLNPLNFMEVLKSDNSSGFTLNWGNDTSKVDPRTPIIYDDASWSYDALWAAGDHGAVVANGEAVKPVNHGYMTTKDGDNPNLYQGGEGCDLVMPFAFIGVTEGVTFTITSVNVIAGVAGKMDTRYKYENGVITLFINQTEGTEWNDYIYNNDKGLQLAYDAALKKGDEQAAFIAKHPFVRDNYGVYWSVEVTYTMVIGASKYPSENIYVISQSKTDDELLNKRTVTLKGMF